VETAHKREGVVLGGDNSNRVYSKKVRIAIIKGDREGGKKEADSWRECLSGTEKKELMYCFPPSEGEYPLFDSSCGERGGEFPPKKKKGHCSLSERFSGFDLRREGRKKPLSKTPKKDLSSSSTALPVRCRRRGQVKLARIFQGLPFPFLCGKTRAELPLRL